MPPTSTSSEKDSPAGSSPSSAPLGLRLCAIHQPNLFPRLSTLAKIFAADCWIVLDDVQFARRDYQHRARIAPLERPEQHQWLTLPTHLPHGRSTIIRQARLVDPLRSRRRMRHTLAHQYGSSRYWPEFRALLDAVTDTMERTDRTAVVAETSTRLLLQLLGWTGRSFLSSQFTVRSERSLRLADLVQAVDADGYLCGPGGMRYLRPEPFANQRTAVIPFMTPSEGIWQGARKVSALHALMAYGPDAVSEEVRRIAAVHRASPNSHSGS
ncbi:WbqC family protein [Myceligenerans pegani]|uniref:WbqC family protein n=1 Tax=Myceligenerans pegani TaxID=2776917 RepID=A0ABR9N1D7_9MICO|nr:WbqC family protein [Myceligenerans sp. TRM 65318]MBE1877468.1 WbqC family protein [Myceligenerans sp. TRM 65318]MBE3019739.1 WbqC family protein [Myceligenerans sp. TRM 65318]